MAQTDASQPVEVKHDWYQSDTMVVVTVLLRGVQSSEVELTFADDASFRLQAPNAVLEKRLSHSIIPAESTYAITPSKIEVKLKKRDGIRWDRLEAITGAVANKPANEATNAAKSEENCSTTTSTSKPPAYPSSRPGGKDWSQVEREIAKQLDQEAKEGDEKLSELFQKIYSEGNDEVKKAMNKSFMESGGTVLSTNWSEISKEKVSISPPDGMEWKKWD